MTITIVRTFSRECRLQDTFRFERILVHLRMNENAVGEKFRSGDFSRNGNKASLGRTKASIYLLSIVTIVRTKNTKWRLEKDENNCEIRHEWGSGRRGCARIYVRKSFRILSRRNASVGGTAWERVRGCRHVSLCTYRNKKRVAIATSIVLSVVPAYMPRFLLRTFVPSVPFIIIIPTLLFFVVVVFFLIFICFCFVFHTDCSNVRTTQLWQSRRPTAARISVGRRESPTPDIFAY